MALIADNPSDRAQQMLALTERLTETIARETELMRARQPLPEGEGAEEKQRLVNAYRLEMARIRDDRGLIAEAPDALRARLRAATVSLQDALAAHEAALGALKALTEGLVQAMAEEVARLRAGGGSYGASGAMTGTSGPTPVALNETA
ncbi:MAG: flagellar basal body protein [Hyphomonadaceae bacterium]